jgi:hypothetical protein
MGVSFFPEALSHIERGHYESQLSDGTLTLGHINV